LRPLHSVRLKFPFNAMTAASPYTQMGEKENSRFIICVNLRHLRAKVFFYSLIRFVLQDKIFAELRDFLLQWQ
jgi:hypothetical protein